MPVVSSFLAAFFEIAGVVLDLYIWVLLIGAVLSWLIAFDIVNRGNRFVRMVEDFCYRVTEPLLGPIRRRLPPMGGLDLSPLLLIFAVMFVQSFLRHLMMSLL